MIFTSISSSFLVNQSPPVKRCLLYIIVRSTSFFLKLYLRTFFISTTNSMTVFTFSISVACHAVLGSIACLRPKSLCGIRPVPMKNGHELSAGPRMTLAQSTKLNATRRLPRVGITFKLCLQIICLCTKYKISWLVECIPSNALRVMFGFHDRMSSRCSLASYLGKLAGSFTGQHQVTCT